MGDIYVPGDDIFWIADQAAYGTAIADDAGSGWAELQCRGGLITPDILKRDVKADRERRYKDTADHAVSETGAVPLITMPDMIVRKDDLSRFLYSYFNIMPQDFVFDFVNRLSGGF